MNQNENVEQNEELKQEELEQDYDWEGVSEPEDDDESSQSFDDDESDDEEEEPAPAEPEEPAQTPAAEPTPPKEPEPNAETPPAEATETPEKKEGEGEPEPPKPTEEKPEEQPQEPTPSEQQPQAAEKEQQALSELEKYYQLNEDEAAELEANPATVLPKLAAKVQLRAFQSAVHAMNAVLPVMMEQYYNQKQQTASLEEKFYSVNPHLRGQDTETIVRHIKAYRAANPGADVDTVIREAGLAASIALKVEIPGVTEAPAPAHRKPVTPAAPGGQTQVRSREEISEEDYWGELAEDDDED